MTTKSAKTHLLFIVPVLQSFKLDTTIILLLNLCQSDGTVYIADSKSAASRLVGSNPISGTTPILRASKSFFTQFKKLIKIILTTFLLQVYSIFCTSIIISFLRINHSVKGEL